MAYGACIPVGMRCGLGRIHAKRRAMSPRARETGPNRSHRTRRLPAWILVALGVPLTIAAVIESTGRIGATFPGFLLMENRVIPTVSGRDWPDRKADVFHAWVSAIDGRPVASVDEVFTRVTAAPAGTRFTYTLEKGGHRFEVDIASRTFGAIDFIEVYGILLLIGILNLLLGAVVGFLRPEARSARLYVWLSLVGCVFSVSPVFLHQAGFPLLTFAYLAAESAFPAVLLHFALAFPVERTGRPWSRYVLRAVYSAALLLTVCKSVGFHHEPPELLCFYLSYTAIAFGFVVFLALLAVAYLRAPDPRTQLRVRTLLPSVAFAGALGSFAFLDNAAGGGSFPLQFGLLLVPFFYASVAYAIVTQDLFGIDRFVRATLAYTLLSVAVFAAYTVVVSMLPTFAATLGSYGRTPLGLGFVLIALLVEPLRRVAQAAVDRAFFRTPWSYRDTVRRVAHEMTTWRNVERIVDEVSTVLVRDMQLEAVVLWLGDEGAAWRRAAGTPLSRETTPWSTAVAAAVERLASGILDADSLTDGLVELGQRFAIEPSQSLVLRLRFAERTTGFLWLGPPRSRRPWTDDDLDLLRTVADQVAIAVENARSYEALEAHNRTLNDVVRQRTAQLMQSEQLASLGQLVAGVAHELNNPIAAVASSVENLDDTITELERLVGSALGPGQAQAGTSATMTDEAHQVMAEAHELVAICREGSERVRGIVRDLLVFARPDRGNRFPVDVGVGLESTLRLLSARIEGAGIHVHTEFDAVPEIRANPTQIHQVWMNILANAVDALCERSTEPRAIRVRLLREPESVVVEVADNGPGMSSEVRARIFEPFLTTKDIGRGTGLGMSIAYGIVRDHGGTIEVESRPGAGTQIRVRLPIETAA